MRKFNYPFLKADSKIIDDVRALFTGQRTGHLGYLLYGPMHFPNTDFLNVDYWEVNQVSQDFYIPAEEEKILEKALKDVSFAVKTVIDLGPGEDAAIQKKSMAVLKKLQARKYIPVDTTRTYAEHAATFANVPSEVCVANFFDNVLPIQKEKNALLFMAGSTITNIPVDRRVTDATLPLSLHLRNFRFAVDDHSYFLIGYDANQDTETLDRSYNNPTFANVIKNLMWRIRLETGFDFDPSLFAYEGQWIPEEHRFAHNLVAKEDVTIKGPNESFFFPKGHVFHVQNSYKFPPEMMIRAGENAGWKAKKVWTETGRVHYILFEAV